MFNRKLTSATLLASLAFAGAQDLNSLPACARDPIATAVTASGCPLSETACICTSTAFLNAISVTIPAACSPEDVGLVISSGRLLCPNLGGGSGSASTTSPAAGVEPSATPSPSDGGNAPSQPPSADGQSPPAASTTAPTTADPSISTSPKIVPDTTSSTTTSVVTSISTITSSSITTAPNSTVTTSSHSSTSSYQSTFTGAAASDKGKGIMAVVVGVFGAVALI